MSVGGILKYAGSNMWGEIGRLGAGNTAKAYSKRALQGGAAMAGISGVAEWSQGGSFWSGAKSGFWSGAMYGAGARAVRVGSGAAQWRDTFKAYGGAGDAMSTAYKTGAKGKMGGHISGQLKNILNNDARVNLANGIKNSRKAGWEKWANN